jgi:hypothetical protein
MRLGIGSLSLCFLWACASAAPAPRNAEPAVASSPDAAAPLATAPLPPLASLDTLSARARALAPGMHEVARGELSEKTLSSAQLFGSDAADTCARVAIAASTAQPVHAWLTDARGDVLADLPAAADATFGPRGPICVRKNDRVTLHVDANGPWVARFVAWASP